MTYVEIKGSEYPVKYSMSAILWFGDFLGVHSHEIGEVIDGSMTERKAMALMYSGLVAGAEATKKRLDISFDEFQEYCVLNDSAEDLMNTLGTLFQKQFTVLATKLEKRMENKKKPVKRQSTSKKSTSRSSSK